MKKLIIILISIMLLMSCNASIKIIDEEGWEIVQCGWALDDNQVLIQSHDGYIIGDRIYNEHIDTIYKTETEERTIKIVNPTNREIDVKLTHNSVTKWIKINANDSYLVGVACFQ